MLKVGLSSGRLGCFRDKEPAPDQEEPETHTKSSSWKVTVA